MSRDPREAIKREDSVKLPNGSIHEISDIQYVHNRYHLLGVSGWQYGIQSLELMQPKSAYIYWFDQTKQLKEDNARLTCQFTGAEQKYLTQSNVIAELRGRVEELQEELEMLENKNENLLGGLKTHQTASIQWESQAIMAEEREQKLKEALQYEIELHVMLGTYSRVEELKELLSTLYPLDREDTNE